MLPILLDRGHPLSVADLLHFTSSRQGSGITVGQGQSVRTSVKSEEGRLQGHCFPETRQSYTEVHSVSDSIHNTYLCPSRTNTLHSEGRPEVPALAWELLAESCWEREKQSSSVLPTSLSSVFPGLSVGGSNGVLVLMLTSCLGLSTQYLILCFSALTAAHCKKGASLAKAESSPGLWV